MKAWIGIAAVMGIAVLGVAMMVYRGLGGSGEGAGLQLSGELARRGFQVANQQGCVACHTLDGRPGIGPTWRGMYGKAETMTDGSTAVVDDAYIRESIRNPAARVVQGFQNLMLPYPLSPEELDALVEFTRQLAE